MVSPEKPVSVLLADDEPANLLSLEGILEPLGVRLVRANSGSDALRRVLEEDFAVILLDVRMPDMSGIEAATLIRSRASSQSTPIIFLTGVEKSREMMFEGYSAGAVDYLMKPIVPSVLRSKVEVFTELATTRQQLQAELRERARAAEALSELNERLRRSNDELARSNAELDAFCAAVSHDLRTPLGHVTGFIELLHQTAADKFGPAEERYMRLISQSASRMTELIEDFLRFARLGSQAMQRGLVDMAACVQDAVDQLTLGAPARPVDWQIGPLPQAEGDDRLLRQVWINLVSNALKYSRHAAPPRIRIEGTVAGTELVYSVSDNGVGFDAAKAQRLFTAFTRLHSGSEFEGIGIGLASVKRIVQRHHGRVWADSEPGRGARFHFALPAAAGGPDA